MNFSPVVELVGEAQSSSIPKSAVKLIEQEFLIRNQIKKDIPWLSGHISPRSAHILINKFSNENNFKNVLLKKFTKPYSYDFNKTIKNYDVIGCVREPMSYLISQLNWYSEIYKGRDPEFFYRHNVIDMARISFYLSKFEKSSIGFLSHILNLNLLNSQCHFIAPRLIINQDYKTALSEVKKFAYVGRTENLTQLVKKATYSENEFAIFHTNSTKFKEITWDDFDPFLKDFLYKRMKPDFLLYEAVQNTFS
jgi:hypothetical protein